MIIWAELDNGVDVIFAVDLDNGLFMWLNIKFSCCLHFMHVKWSPYKLSYVEQFKSYMILLDGGNNKSTCDNDVWN